MKKIPGSERTSLEVLEDEEDTYQLQTLSGGMAEAIKAAQELALSSVRGANLWNFCRFRTNVNLIILTSLTRAIANFD